MPFQWIKLCLLMFLLMAVSIGASSATLEEAIESAITSEPALRASLYNLQATEENIAIARSRLLPQITLQGSSSQLTQTTTQDPVSYTHLRAHETG
jgi:outer membrane protein TolC